MGSYTGGDLNNVNLTSPQNIGGQEVKVQQAVCLKSGVAGEPVTITNSGNSNISISIPDSTTIMSNTSWDGTLIPPKAVPVAGTAPAGLMIILSPPIFPERLSSPTLPVPKLLPGTLPALPI